MTTENTTSIEYKMKAVLADLEVLHSILMLEYHDMNHLSGSPKSRNENQRRLVKSVKGNLLDIKTQLNPKSK